MKKKFIILSLVVIVIDLLSKTLVSETMALYDSITVIPGFFSILYIKNTGAAWSILAGQRWFFILLSSVVCLVLINIFIKEKENPWMLSGLALMFAGTFGNLYDRIVYHAVRDMLSFNIFGYDYPVFNVADISLVIGVFLIAVNIYLEERSN